MTQNAFKTRLARLHQPRHRFEQPDAPRVFTADGNEHQKPSPEPTPTKTSLETHEHSYQLDASHGSFPLATHVLTPMGEKHPRLVPENVFHNILFLDIETSSLHATDTIFCVSLGFWDAGMFHVKQWMILDPRDEEHLLEQVFSHMEDADALCTFNGKSFDIPRLKARADMLGVPFPPGERRHFDLLHLTKKACALPSTTLGSVERACLGFERVGDIPGREIPALWQRAKRAARPSMLHSVLTHNRDDVLSLTSILGLIYKRALYAQGNERVSPNAAPRHIPTATTQRDPAQDSPVHTKLTRSYRLRAKSHQGQSTPQQQTQISPTNTAQRTSRKPAGVPAHIVTSLREQISSSLAQGTSIAELGPLVFELVALAPHHPLGLSYLHQYYISTNQRECALYIEQRLEKNSPYS